MSRNYEVDPIEVEFKIKMYYYEQIPKVELEKKLKDMCNGNTSPVLEGIFYELQLCENAGMEGMTASIITPPEN